MTTINPNSMEPSPSPKAVKRCAEWLAYCLSIGYKKSHLMKLEEIWWTFKDFNGNLKT